MARIKSVASDFICATNYPSFGFPLLGHAFLKVAPIPIIRIPLLQGKAFFRDLEILTDAIKRKCKDSGFCMMRTEI